jgi:hypothetical protein
VNARALKGVTAPRAMGRRRVRVTCGSRFRSHKSFIVQPAPRIINAPLKKRSDVVMTDRGDVIGMASGAANRVENRHGKKR